VRFKKCLLEVPSARLKFNSEKKEKTGAGKMEKEAFSARYIVQLSPFLNKFGSLVPLRKGEQGYELSCWKFNSSISTINNSPKLVLEYGGRLQNIVTIGCGLAWYEEIDKTNRFFSNAFISPLIDNAVSKEMDSSLLLSHSRIYYLVVQTPATGGNGDTRCI
jgi:hypothetical protein